MTPHTEHDEDALQDQLTVDLKADRVLLGAMQANLRSVTLVGEGLNGETYFASTHADNAQTLWDLEVGRQILMDSSVE